MPKDVRTILEKLITPKGVVKSFYIANYGGQKEKIDQALKALSTWILGQKKKKHETDCHFYRISKTLCNCGFYKRNSTIEELARKVRGVK